VWTGAGSCQKYELTPIELFDDALTLQAEGRQNI
jgi:hypothetical protein